MNVSASFRVFISLSLNGYAGGVQNLDASLKEKPGKDFYIYFSLL
jgi:hypothetical protein